MIVDRALKEPASLFLLALDHLGCNPDEMLIEAPQMPETERRQWIESILFQVDDRRNMPKQLKRSLLSADITGFWQFGPAVRELLRQHGMDALSEALKPEMDKFYVS